MAHERLVSDNWVERRCVLLEPLDEKKQPILKDGKQVFACGFIIDGAWDNVQGNYRPESGKCFLYTCWHVVAGHDPSDTTTPSKYIQRKYLRIHNLLVNATITDPIASLGSDDLTVALYDQNGTPAWQQEVKERPHKDFKTLGIRVPDAVDAVRIELPMSRALIELSSIDPTHIMDQFFEIGEDVFVSGFPYGFSATGPKALQPVFLKRSVASRFTKDYQITLLNSACAPVMSGGPVFKRVGNDWQLVGMYCGSVFTAPELKNDAEKKATALGQILSIAVIRQSIGTEIK